MKKVKSRKAKVVRSSKAIISEVRQMKAPEPIRPCKGRFIDYIIDMYEVPDQIQLRTVYSGEAGGRQDAINMRSYFNSARSKLLVGS